MPLTAFYIAFTTQAFADNTLPIDFYKTVLPILKNSCFACHVAGTNAPDASKDPVLIKKKNKVVGDGIDDFTMDEKFPFPADKSVTKQLKHLEKELTQHNMPPDSQSKLGLGLPLSDKNRKILLDWIAQEKNNPQDIK